MGDGAAFALVRVSGNRLAKSIFISLMEDGEKLMCVACMYMYNLF